MLNRRQKHILLKFFSLFSVVRGYNILIVVLAQYLTAIFILSQDRFLKGVLLDVNVLMLVMATAATIAAGYIINNFYDYEKDLINRPNKTMLDRLVSQNTKLSFYFVLNFLAVIFASYVSFKAVLFFAIYIFGIWLYSHKLKRMALVGNLTSAILTITPFFAVFVYYRNFETVIFVHALFLFLLLTMRELTKDLENIKGDLALNYQTIPVVYGERKTRIVLLVLALLTLLPTYTLVYYFNTGNMKYYFLLSIVVLFIYMMILKKSHTKRHFNWLHNLLKFIIVVGVFCIPLIDIELVLNKLV